MQTILVIEHNEVTCDLIRMELEAEGFAVQQATTGRAAIETMIRMLPDLVIQDLVLPDVNGLELAAILRGVPGARGLPILACSGFAKQLEYARQATGLFNDYLAKPVDGGTLRKAIRPFLGKIRTAYVN
jgi:two-component system phosphate regulon response regulator PhoB